MNASPSSAAWTPILLRAALPLAALLGVGVAVWQAGQFEVRPNGEGTPFVLADPRPGRHDWPGWRGATQQGVIESEFPTPPASGQAWMEQWRTLWKPSGRSGPCVWGEQVFVTGCDVRLNAIVLASFQRTSGAIDWQVSLGTAPDGRSAIDQQAQATPVCDGERVFVPVSRAGELHLVAVQRDGRIAWDRAVGPTRQSPGARSSPCLFGPLVIVACDQPGTSFIPGQSGSYLAAVHRQTGQLVYRIARPNADGGGTPVVATIAGRPQLVLTGRGGIRSYDPATGRELWHCDWKSGRSEGSVAVDEDHVFAVSGTTDGELVCVRADGDGDVTDSHVVWRERRLGQVALSPLLTQSGLVVLTRDGQLQLFHRETGRLLWQKRSLGSCSTPPWRVGTDGVAVVTDEGLAVLLNADRRGEVLWESPLGTTVVAPPAISQGQFLVRSPDGLRMIGSVPRSPLVQQPPKSRQPL